MLLVVVPPSPPTANWKVGVAWTTRKEFLFTEIEKMAGLKWGDWTNLGSLFDISEDMK